MRKLQKCERVFIVVFFYLVHLKLAQWWIVAHAHPLTHQLVRSLTRSLTNSLAFASHNGPGLIVQKCFGDKWRWRNVCVHEKGLSHIIHRGHSFHSPNKTNYIICRGNQLVEQHLWCVASIYQPGRFFLLRVDFVFFFASSIHPKWKMVLFQKRFALKLSDPQRGSATISWAIILRRLLKIGVWNGVIYG